LKLENENVEKWNQNAQAMKLHFVIGAITTIKVTTTTAPD